MSVDTKELRELTEYIVNEHWIDILRSAADELDELKKALETRDDGWWKKLDTEREAWAKERVGFVSDVETERAAHEATKRELKTEREAHGCAIKLNNELGIELGDTRNHLNALAEKWAATCARLESAESALQQYADERAPISEVRRGGEHYETRVGKLARAHFERFKSGGGNG